MPRNKGSRGRRKRKLRLLSWVPSATTRKRWWKKYRRRTAGQQLIIGLAVLIVVWFAVNGLYQVVRKPTELFFPVSGVLNKSPQATWVAYASSFRKHSTASISPALLAALAQVEGSGNPIARTYWRWSFTHKPFEVYRPASSAVGMYQITDGTFAIARRYCVHDHVVVEDGPWNDWRSCWFNWLYSRVVPTNAIELTAAYLDREVATQLARRGIVNASVEQKGNLAALIHLCGAGAGAVYVQRGFRLRPLQRCGDHDAAVYVQRVHAYRLQFERFDR